MALVLYAGSWAFKVPLGLIRPCANLAYFYYSDWEWLDGSLYVLYRPCERLFPPGVTHIRDRVYPQLETMGP